MTAKLTRNDVSVTSNKRTALRARKYILMNMLGLLLLGLLVTPALCVGQNRVPEGIASLRVYSSIKVKPTGLPAITAEYIATRGDTIILYDERTNWIALQVAEIDSVWVSKHRARETARKAAMFGAIAGGLCLAVSGFSEDPIAGAGVGAVVGAIIGGLAGAALGQSSDYWARVHPD